MLDIYLNNEFFGLIFFLIFGLLWGSFANVVIFRLPQSKSVVTPRSACPHCSALIKWYDNLPIISWVLLMGKCRNCKLKISWRYPLVELIMGLLFMAIFYKFGWSWLTLEYLIFIFGLVVVSFIDFDHMILPDSFTLGGLVVGLMGAALNPERTFLPALYGVLLGGGFLWAVAYIYYLLRKEEGMGGGDIKLLGWIGSILTWTSVPFVILVSSLIGTLVGVILSLSTKRGLKTAIPFGPYLALAAIIYIFGGEEIGNWYIRIFMPALLPVD